MNRSVTDPPPGAEEAAIDETPASRVVDVSQLQLSGRLAGLTLPRQVLVLAIWPFMESLFSLLVGTVDLALAGRKVSGNAQRRTRETVLHHGTLLYGFEAARSERLLRRPLREPAYRAGRGDTEFLGNLPLGAEEIVERLRAGW